MKEGSCHLIKLRDEQIRGRIKALALDLLCSIHPSRGVREAVGNMSVI